MPVGEMLARMSSAELTEWMAYFKVINQSDAPQKGKTSDALRAMFAHRIVKKDKP